MAARLQDYCAETVPGPGTGTITCPGTATAGGKTFASSFSNGDTVFYQLIAGSQLEMGIGTWNSAGTLARTTVLWNSAGTTSPLNITTTGVCVCQLPAQRGAWYDDGPKIVIPQQPSVKQDIVQVLRVDGTYKWGSHVPAGKWGPVSWDTVVQNGIGMASADISTFTIPTTGIYRVSCFTLIDGSNIGSANGGSGAASQNSDAFIGFFLDGVLLAQGGRTNNSQFQQGSGGSLVQPYSFDNYVNLNCTFYAQAGQSFLVQGMCWVAKNPASVGTWYGSVWNQWTSPVQRLGGSGSTLAQTLASELRITQISQ